MVGRMGVAQVESDIVVSEQGAEEGERVPELVDRAAHVQLGEPGEGTDLGELRRGGRGAYRSVLGDAEHGADERGVVHEVGRGVEERERRVVGDEGVQPIEQRAGAGARSGEERARAARASAARRSAKQESAPEARAIGSSAVRSSSRPWTTSKPRAPTAVLTTGTPEAMASGSFRLDPSPSVRALT